MKVFYELKVGNGGDHGYEEEMNVIAECNIEYGKPVGFIVLNIEEKRYELNPDEILDMVISLGYVKPSVHKV